ncbi:MAG: hypothetical protein ABIN83_02380 [Sphingomicrobium sp.]
MSQVKFGAIVLGIASLTMMGVMLVHPSHIDQAPVLGPFGFSGVVHAFAILAHVAFLYGAWSLSRYQGFDRATPGLALAFAGLAAVAMVNAAMISMFVVPFAAGHAMPGTVDPHNAAAQGVHVWVAANRGFAQIYVALQSIAIAIWALAWRGNAMRAAGLIAGLGVLAWQLTGWFQPSVHTMPIVMIVQGAWLIAAASIMFRSADQSAEPSASKEYQA